MGHHISKEITDPLAEGNVAIKSSASLENFLEGAFTKEIAPNGLQRLARIKHVAVGIDSGKHRGIAVERPEF